VSLADGRRRRYVGAALIVLAVLLLLLTLGLAFTMYAYLAAVLAVLCLALGTVLLVRKSLPR
jgi:drug/metabolite transporter (DMT)-like permease